jgi:hypothetical protein
MSEQHPDLLASVTALGLNRLTGEPLRLRAEARELEAVVGRLALQNYRVFIASHDVVKALRNTSKVGVAVVHTCRWDKFLAQGRTA